MKRCWQRVLSPAHRRVRLNARAAGCGRASRRAVDPVLSATALEKRFGAVRALAGLDLTINPGEFFALLGGSGSGKSTLLRVLAGFEAPDAGTLTLDGQDLLPVPPWARPINMMFQSYALFPHMSVGDNIAYGLKRAGVAAEERRNRIMAALDLVGLQGLEARRPQQLSGGQKQRVALARSLVMRPRVLLLDEPMAALDAGLRERTGLELRALQRKTGAAFIMVTHDQQEALALADRIAVLDAGRVAQIGPPQEVYARPATRFVARFLGAANVLEGRMQDGVFESAEVGGVIASGLPADTIAIALRAEQIRLTSADEAPRITGILEDAAFRGDDWLTIIRLPGGASLRVVHDTAPPAQGSLVGLLWEAGAVVPLFA
ncbi:MAG: ABC transporter ATP-binding protein [Roseomonas sp.]|nr:ABC transporter ATP-binding protein [Roseomonas sp.]MCA3379438.1 ABC transporter ATP-binding protein [Roseomonas sp.]